MKKTITLEIDFIHNPDDTEVENAVRDLIATDLDMFSMYREKGVTGFAFSIDDTEDLTAEPA